MSSFRVRMELDDGTPLEFDVALLVVAEPVTLTLDDHALVMRPTEES